MNAALLLAAAAALPAPHEGPTLHVLTHERWFEAFEVLEEVAREFERTHPGVRVKLLDGGGAGGGMDQLMLSLAGGLPVDVAWIDVTEFASYLADDVLLDLQPYFDADPTWEPTSTFPRILDAMRGPDGHLYGVCSTFTPYVMYVNESLLAREGVARPPPEWTWEDLARICREVTRDEDGDGRPEQYGISITQWMQALAPWIWQNGGRFLDDDGRSALGEPEAVEAVRFLVRLLHEEGVASDDATFRAQTSVGLFQAGRTAFYGPVGYWETYHFRHITDFRWDVLPLPRGREPATSVAMRFYVVPRATRHPGLAYEFVRALGGETMQRGLAEIGNGVPGLISAATSPSFLKPDVPPAREEVFFEVLEHARFMPLEVDWREVERRAQAALEEALLLGRSTAEEACREAARIADETIERAADVRGRPYVGAGWFLVAELLVLGAFVVLVLALLRRRPPPLARREERAAWVFLLPWAAGFTLLLAGPALVALLLSFSEWSPIQGLESARWMGADQYARLAADGTFHDSLRVTGWYVLLAVPLQLAFALLLALLVRPTFRGVGAFRTFFYLPTVLSPVVLGALWRSLLDDDGGLFGELLRRIGVAGPDWLGDPTWVVPSFVFMGLWTVGAQMLVFLAGLQGVDPTLYEAARLDGAGGWARFRHVTLPAISPVVLLNLVVGIVNAFQLFAQPYVMTDGGPGNESRFLALYLYEQGFRFFRMGYASTLAWVLFVLILVLTLLVLRSARRWVHYAGAGR